MFEPKGMSAILIFHVTVPSVWTFDEIDFDIIIQKDLNFSL